MDTTIEIRKKKKDSFWLAISAFFKVFVKSFKFFKVFLIGGSFAAYAYMFTWEFAAMLLIMIFIHEYGHVYAMKKCGLKVKGIYLIPFLGGVAISEDTFKSRRDESYIALMGPWFGFGISLIYLLCFYITDNPIFAAGCAWCSMINLFNLLPMNPLDGGRVMKSLTFSIGDKTGLIFLSLSLLLMIFITFFYKIWFFMLLLFFGALEFAYEYRKNIKDKKRKLEIYNRIQKNNQILAEINMDIAPNEESEEILNKLIAEEMPKMNRKQMFFYASMYVLTCIIFFKLIDFVEHIPGCKEALDVLK